MCIAGIAAWMGSARAGLLAAALLAGLATPAPALAAPALATPRGDAVTVKVDHAKIVRLPAKAQTVIVGNPAIADVSVQRNGIMVVTGKSFGVTNLIALDAGGALLAESLLSVGAADDAIVTVQRGMDRESYSCTPQCQPSARLGDSAEFFGRTSGQARARAEAATGAR
jgi:Flp pilus assembly secretin CpaC